MEQDKHLDGRHAVEEAMCESFQFLGVNQYSNVIQLKLLCATAPNARNVNLFDAVIWEILILFVSLISLHQGIRGMWHSP